MPVIVNQRQTGGYSSSQVILTLTQTTQRHVADFPSLPVGLLLVYMYIYIHVYVCRLTKTTLHSKQPAGTTKRIRKSAALRPVISTRVVNVVAIDFLAVRKRLHSSWTVEICVAIVDMYSRLLPQQFTPTNLRIFVVFRAFTQINR